jgi:hypothetical protein
MTHPTHVPEASDEPSTGAELLSLLASRGPMLTVDELDELEATVAEQRAQLPEVKWTTR